MGRDSYSVTYIQINTIPQRILSLVEAVGACLKRLVWNGRFLLISSLCCTINHQHGPNKKNTRGAETTTFNITAHLLFFLGAPTRSRYSGETQTRSDSGYEILKYSSVTCRRGKK